MKLKYILICFALLQSSLSHGQEKSNKKKNPVADYLGANYAAQYSLAIQTKDYQAACSALYGLLAINDKDTNSLNCLLSIYFQRRQPEQCFLLSKQYLAKNRDNVTLLDYCGKSAELLDRYTDALECYQKLYIITKELYYGYMCANVEYGLGRKQESSQHVDELLKDPYAMTDKITLYMDTASDARSMVVVMKAALLNLKANALSDLGDYKSARQLFFDALKLEPQFDLAQKGLDKIKYK